jgi:hypothetical protein
MDYKWFADFVLVTGYILSAGLFDRHTASACPQIRLTYRRALIRVPRHEELPRSVYIQ